MECAHCPTVTWVAGTAADASAVGPTSANPITIGAKSRDSPRLTPTFRPFPRFRSASALIYVHSVFARRADTQVRVACVLRQGDAGGGCATLRGSDSDGIQRARP